MTDQEMPAEGSAGSATVPEDSNDRTFDRRPVRLGAAWNLAVITAAVAADDAAAAAAVAADDAAAAAAAASRTDSVPSRVRIPRSHERPRADARRGGARARG